MFISIYFTSTPTHNTHKNLSAMAIYLWAWSAWRAWMAVWCCRCHYIKTSPCVFVRWREKSLLLRRRAYIISRHFVLFTFFFLNSLNSLSSSSVHFSMNFKCFSLAKCRRIIPLVNRTLLPHSQVRIWFFDNICVISVITGSIHSRWRIYRSFFTVRSGVVFPYGEYTW